MLKRVIGIIALILMVIVMAGAMFMAGYSYYQPREILVDRWHEPEVIIVEPLEFETLRIETVSTSYEPLPAEFIEVAIRGLDQAIYSHQYYIDNEDVTEGSFAWHQRTIDKYEIAIMALEYSLLRDKEEAIINNKSR